MLCNWCSDFVENNVGNQTIGHKFETLLDGLESFCIVGDMAKSDKRLKVLFLCTGNSCRSQMAEGWTRRLKSDIIDAYSAGIEPCGINPTAVEVMAEAGVDISGHNSKHMDELKGIDFDYVVTVCDSARERCPVFPGKARMYHKSFDDPAAFSGSAEEIRAGFCRVRDEIKKFVEMLPSELERA